MSDRATFAELICRVTTQAGGEMPAFAILDIRDWWYLRRGPRWRFPLPPRRAFKSLQQRGALSKFLHASKEDGELYDFGRRAFVPAVFVRSYTNYGTLDPWINGASHRGRMKPRRPAKIAIALNRGAS